MKKLQLWTLTFLLAHTLFIAIEGHADSDRPSINTNGMVRLVYFLPRDRPARTDRVTAIRQLIKDAQQFYADEMNRHGFGRKTFILKPMQMENLSSIKLTESSERNITTARVQSGRNFLNTLTAMICSTSISLR